MTSSEPMPRVLTLSEVAERLNMKRSNVAKFLARRGIQPSLAKASGYLWREDLIDAVKADREADEARMAADARRREGALHGAAVPSRQPPELQRLGSTQRELLARLCERPVRPISNSDRLALRRLRERGLVALVPGERGIYQLTPEGGRTAGLLTPEKE